MTHNGCTTYNRCVCTVYVSIALGVSTLTTSIDAVRFVGYPPSGLGHCVSGQKCTSLSETATIGSDHRQTSMYLATLPYLATFKPPFIPPHSTSPRHPWPLPQACHDPGLSSLNPRPAPYGADWTRKAPPGLQCLCNSTTMWKPVEWKPVLAASDRFQNKSRGLPMQQY